MDTVKGGARYGDPRGGSPAAAANDPVMDGAGQPAGWDPFEVWRTRVRDVQQKRSQTPAPAPKA